MSTEIRESDLVEQSHEVRDEWIAAVDALYRQAEIWAEGQRWQTQRKSIINNEKRLGTYEVWQLVVKTDQGRIVFRPVARDITGALGRIDLIARPSRFPTRMIGRLGPENWQIAPFGDSTVVTAWNEANFIDLMQNLIPSAA
jgi:hypothetical protein